MKSRLAWAILPAALLLVACTNPVPPDKTAYVGEWCGPNMSLLITDNGTVVYWRKKGGNTTSIAAPLKKFDGDNLVVGVGLWTTTFVVSKPPHQDAGRWKMMVDGVELTQVSTNAMI